MKLDRRKLVWLPPGKKAAVCFSIDDIHPGKSTDAYEAGGDLGQGALGRVEWLLRRHPYLYVDLFVTPDWREINWLPTRQLMARIPYLRDRIYLAKILPVGAMHLARHPEFVRYLKQLPRIEVAMHGLHHIHKGLRPAVEFQEQDADECRRILEQAMAIFREAGLEFVCGMTPPGWDLTPALAKAMEELNFSFVASARDIVTPVKPEAVTNMSGIKGASLIYPQLIEGSGLVHITSNFQATSSIERAIQIIEANGLLAIKGHIVQQAFGVSFLDGMGELYRNYLDVLFSELHRHYGDSLWWTSMSKVATLVQANSALKN